MSAWRLHTSSTRYSTHVRAAQVLRFASMQSSTWNALPKNNISQWVLMVPCPPRELFLIECSRAHRFAELASDAPLLASGVAAQHVLATEACADRPLLEGVVHLQQAEQRTLTHSHGNHEQYTS